MEEEARHAAYRVRCPEVETIQQDRTAVYDASVEEVRAWKLAGGRGLVTSGQSKLHGLCVVASASSAATVAVYDSELTLRPDQVKVVHFLTCPAGDSRTVWFTGGVSVQSGLLVESSGNPDHVVVYYSVR